MSETRKAAEIGKEWTHEMEELVALHHNRKITTEQFKSGAEDLRKHYEPLFRYASSRNH